MVGMMGNGAMGSGLCIVGGKWGKGCVMLGTVRGRVWVMVGMAGIAGTAV